jgi:spore coat protein CotH
MFRSIRWKRHRRLVFALTAGFLILIVGFGGTRVSAITSSERHATEAFISVDIPGRVDLFDDTQVHEIAIKFDMADYERLIAAYQQDNEKEFIEASITIDGTTISPVGIRLKGNSTLMGLRRAGQTSGQGGAGNRVMPAGGGMGSNVSADNPDSLPWLVSFDEYVAGQRYQGYKEIAIRPVLTSKTMLNEALALELIGDAGEASQQTSYSSFSLNGGGAALRLVVEVPGDNYAADNFEHQGVLYKALSTGSFAYRGDDPLAYETSFKQITRKNQQDLQPLITLLRWVNTASDEEFAAKLGEYVDIESLARYIALQSLLNNFDDMSGPGQNYCLWYDLDTGKFSVLTWDMNLSFGQGMGGGMVINNGGQAMPGGQMPGGGQLPGGARPGNGPVIVNGRDPGGNRVGGPGGNKLKERFLASAAFKETYNRAYAEMHQALYGSGAALAELDRIAAVIAASNLLDTATIEGEVVALRTVIATQTAKTTP